MAEILGLLTAFSHRLNIDRNMNGAQLLACAEDLVDSDEFFMLRPDDYHIFFKNAVSGLYGEFYGRLDQPTVFGMLRKFCADRDTVIARNRDKELEANNIYEIMSHPQVLESVKQVAEKFDADRKPEPEPVKERQYSPLEAQILNEWDANDDNSMQGSYKRFNGTYYSFTDYANMRAKQIVEIQQHNKTHENENN